MAIETMAFFLGGLFLAVGLLGGRQASRRLRVPRLSGMARVLSLVVGVLFIGLAIYLKSLPSISEEVEDGAEETEIRRTYPLPMQDGMRLDVCMEPGKDCGEPVATAWCKSHGLTHATDFPQENVGGHGITTRNLDGDDCKDVTCTTFAYITCER